LPVPNRTILGTPEPEISIIPPARVGRVIDERGAGYVDFDEEPRYRRGQRGPQSNSSAGTVCSVLSVIFGCVAFLLCPPLFGMAGLVLGIVGTIISPNKAVGVVGIVLSVIGTIVGMIVGFLLAMPVR
jgi:hypothetical protein